MALVQAIQAEVSGVVLSTGKETTGAAACFQNPVCHDVINTQGTKLAGAGQRRNKLGLLHQGSVALPCNLEISQQRAERLAAALSSSWSHCVLLPPNNVITKKVSERYAAEEWTRSC
jgi:lipoate-protein ligase A